MAQRQRTSKKNPYAHIKRTAGKRSGLEDAIALHLWGGGYAVGFKEEKDIPAIEYRNLKVKKYHPDFQLPNGILIEAKGWFKPVDRNKHLCIKYQHPELDIRFVFSNPNAKINKGSKTTYADWCNKNGFKFSKGTVPKEWIIE